MFVEEIKENIKNYIIENCDIKDLDLGDIDDINILEAGIVNSINVVEYLVFLEEEYDIDLIEEDMEFDDVVNLNKLAKLVCEKTKN